MKRATILHSGKELRMDVHGGAPWNGIPGILWIYMTEKDCAEENEKRMLAEKAQASSSGASVSGRTEPGMKLAAGILGGWKKK